jgi:GDP-4-dehydro-6-deoxy-D-mannose reductase
MTGATLVTGAAGFVGGHMLDRLGRQPAQTIIAWHRPGTPPPAQQHPTPIVWRPVDIVDRGAVMAALEQASPARIFHLAGAPSVETSWRNVVPHLSVNAIGTHNLLDAVRVTRLNCRVLVVSSAQVYQPSDDVLREDSLLRPVTPYGLSKLAQDQLALMSSRDDGLDVCIARPFNHVGPRQSAAFAVSSFARQIARIEAGLSEPRLLVGNLDARRDITDVRDVVEAYERIVEGGQAGRPYNICSGRAWRIRDLLDELMHLTTVPVQVDTDPDRLRPSDIPIVQGDAARMRVELGWAPAIHVEQTLHDTLQWWREQVRLRSNA